MSKRRLFHYESRNQPLISQRAFFWRWTKCFLAAFGIIGGSLLVGMWGYHHFENLNWIDSFANASMILSGMGPLAQPQTDSGKIFAGCYALYSGLLIIMVAGLLLGPIIHRLFHRFHLD